ncbi:MAG TPA: NAD(P)/FAD-dependent oxidoreductase [Terriglobales bacterium]|nr:NAD(P)/FAD-dependent oxidoreductase [Terriglobales bacterium]
MTDCLIVGAGFTGLSAGLELSRQGYRVRILERDDEAGGLAGSFRVGTERLEKFYHHWFTSDIHIMELIRSLGCEDRILERPTRTGMYYAHRFFRLSTPRDVLGFTPLSFVNRLRLGYVALAARRVKDWKTLEDTTAKEWLLKHCGEQVYRVVWEPLLVGKFGAHADEVSAVWFWNKLKLRGGSRGKAGQEVLAYYRGGFAALADEIVKEIRHRGGEVLLNTSVHAVMAGEGKATGLRTSRGMMEADAVLLTTPLPVAAKLLHECCSPAYLASLNQIRHLSNICIVLELSRSLSSTYWLNVNDPSFPFVAVIEHTNFEPASTYAGRHIVYLSKYLPPEDALYRMNDGDATQFAVAALGRMFPDFAAEWVTNSTVWRADYSQPIVGRHHSRLVPDMRAEVEGVFLATMAQIYPEDRGTNYAVRSGKEVASLIADTLQAARAKKAGAGSSFAAVGRN